VSTRGQQHCEHAEQQSGSERDHPQWVERKSARDRSRIADLRGRVSGLAGNSVNTHDASESHDVSVEREENVEDIAVADKRLIFVVHIGFADTRKLGAGAFRSIDNADHQLHFLSLVMHLVGD
jgi:hypothetical protein